MEDGNECEHIAGRENQSSKGTLSVFIFDIDSFGDVCCVQNHEPLPGENLMRTLNVLLAISFSLLLSAPALSQSTNATVSGTIADSTGALIPGVSVTATNTATGVVTTALSNESGAYNFPSLLPGTYKVSAELPGFQTRSYTDVRLGNADKVRLNFTLQVGGVNTAVEVTVAADT